MKDENIILKMENIHKSFPGVKALDSVTFDLKKGEVLGLVGENGAGKSTLMNILTGVLKPNQGTINLEGQNVEFHDNQQAQKHGISYIHQELNLIDELTIMENLFLGDQPLKKWGSINFKEMRERSKKVLKRLNLELSPDQLVEELSLAQKQMVEIAKAILFEAKIIVMDEPTSSLADEEIEVLFEMIEDLQKDGKSIIYISHRLDEVFSLTNRLIVLRNGKKVAVKNTDEVDHDQLVNMMAGKEVAERFFKEETNFGDVILESKNLAGKKTKDINLKLRKGELLGIAGLMGSGRTELLEMMFGVKKIKNGELFLNNNKLHPRNTTQAIKNGLAYLPEDRGLKGLFLDFDLLKNIYISKVEKNEIITNEEKAKEPILNIIEQLNIVTPSAREKIKNLSGGNRQKAILGRWMLSEMDVLLINEPTRGIDVNAKTEIYKFLFELNKQGVGIIMVSSELPEILSISDRIIVMYEGEINGRFTRKEANQERVLKAMTGKKADLAESGVET